MSTHELRLLREGMTKVKNYGTKTGRPFGQPPREIPGSFKKYCPMWKNYEITATELARLLGVSRPTLYLYLLFRTLDL